jgi:Spy/CpxP family protein refolding chaperone
VRDFLQDSVGFNEQQLTKYDQLRQQNRDNMRPLFEDLGNAKLKFYEYVNKPGADSAAQAAAALIGEKQKALDMAFFNHFRQVRELCTPEQLPKYDSQVQHIIQRMVAPPHRGDHRQRKQEKEEKK